jgi:putative transferase (TIGR04331 family)
LEHRIQVGDIHYQHSLYQEAQFNFAECLPKYIHSQLTVRLHKAFKFSGWCDDQRWRDASPSTKIEYGSLAIHQLIKQSRLVIHSYDSTGVLETFALNIPTLCFWPNGIDHVLPAMRPYYELLKSAADFVSSNWDNIDEWWNSSEVQHARLNFCNRFARTNKTPVRVLGRLLRQLEVDHKRSINY